MNVKKFSLLGLLFLGFIQAKAQEPAVVTSASANNFKPAPKFSFNIPLGYTFDESA